MEQFSLFVNIADYILHCTQINSFESGDYIHNRFHENNLLYFFLKHLSGPES